MVDEFGFDWEKHREDQRYWAELRNALWLGIQEHNATVKGTPEQVEKREVSPVKRGRGRPRKESK